MKNLNGECMPILAEPPAGFPQQIPSVPMQGECMFGSCSSGSIAPPTLAVGQPQPAPIIVQAPPAVAAPPPVINVTLPKIEISIPERETKNEITVDIPEQKPPVVNLSFVGTTTNGGESGGKQAQGSAPPVFSPPIQGSPIVAPPTTGQPIRQGQWQEQGQAQQQGSAQNAQSAPNITNNYYLVNKEDMPFYQKDSNSGIIAGDSGNPSRLHRFPTKEEMQEQTTGERTGERPRAESLPNGASAVMGGRGDVYINVVPTITPHFVQQMHAPANRSELRHERRTDSDSRHDGVCCPDGTIAKPFGSGYVKSNGGFYQEGTREAAMQSGQFVPSTSSGYQERSYQNGFSSGSQSVQRLPWQRQNDFESFGGQGGNGEAQGEFGSGWQSGSNGSSSGSNGANGSQGRSNGSQNGSGASQMPSGFPSNPNGNPNGYPNGNSSGNQNGSSNGTTLPPLQVPIQPVVLPPTQVPQGSSQGNPQAFPQTFPQGLPQNGANGSNGGFYNESGTPLSPTSALPPNNPNQQQNTPPNERKDEPKEDCDTCDDEEVEFFINDRLRGLRGLHEFS